jgi:serine/threonine-protein kinase HipA
MGEKLVGTIAETPRREIYFEYSPAWLAEGFSISPYFLPLTSGLKREESLVFEGLLGVFDDSVPDGWGRLLMDRFFRARGLPPESISPLDRLAYIGDHGIGALRYRPAIAGVVAPGGVLNLPLVAEQAERIAAGSPEEALPVLQAIGGSSGGSRPKVFVTHHPTSGRLFPEGTGSEEGFEHWLVKFRTREDPADAGSIEAAYAEMARAAGIKIPATTLFDTTAGRFFAVQRFDRGPGEMRIHTHTFGGLAHSDFRHPNRDYQEFLTVTFDLTKDFAAVGQAYRRAVFNVLAHNRDDHVKNHAFVWALNGGWRLSPAYDLTHSYGVNGQHNMTVAGSGLPGVKELLTLADGAALRPKEAKAIIDSVRAAIGDWPEFAAKAGVSEASVKRIGSSFVSLG